MRRTASLKSVVRGILGSVALRRGVRGPLRVGCRLGRPYGGGAALIYFRARNASARRPLPISEAYLKPALDGGRLEPLGWHGATDIPFLEPGHMVSVSYAMRPLAELLLERGYEETARVDFVVCDHEGKGYRTAVLIRGLREWAEAGEGPPPVPLHPCRTDPA